MCKTTHETFAAKLFVLLNLVGRPVGRHEVCRYWIHMQFATISGTGMTAAGSVAPASSNVCPASYSAHKVLYSLSHSFNLPSQLLGDGNLLCTSPVVGRSLCSTTSSSGSR